MEKVAERRCGLDVHKKTVVACLRTPGPRGRAPLPAWPSRRQAFSRSMTDVTVHASFG